MPSLSRSSATRIGPLDWIAGCCNVERFWAKLSEATCAPFARRQLWGPNRLGRPKEKSAGKVAPKSPKQAGCWNQKRGSALRVSIVCRIGNLAAFLASLAKLGTVWHLHHLSKRFSICLSFSKTPRLLNSVQSPPNRDSVYFLVCRRLVSWTGSAQLHERSSGPPQSHPPSPLPVDDHASGQSICTP